MSRCSRDVRYVILLFVYRPGSSAVTASFFSELADVLDRFSTYVEPLLLAGDINIRRERSTNPHAVEFCELLDSYGLTQHVQDVTYDEGGIVSDVGFSDHRLLRWVSPFQRPPPVYTTVRRRSWRSFSVDMFMADLQTSALCDVRTAI